MHMCTLQASAKKSLFPCAYMQVLHIRYVVFFMNRRFHYNVQYVMVKNKTFPCLFLDTFP